jgi:hypothetical protein
MCGAINFAARRQAVRAAKGRSTVKVTVTVEQLMTKLRNSSYCCALTGLPFWTDDSDGFGPTVPSLDRVDCDGNYSDASVRVVLLGVNILRWRESEADMYRIARALAARALPIEAALWARPGTSPAFCNRRVGRCPIRGSRWARSPHDRPL